MFEQSLLSEQKRGRRGWTVAISTALQLGLLGMGIAVPLLKPEILQRGVWTRIFVEPAVPLPAPRGEPVQRAATSVRSQELGPFTAPRHIPDRTPVIIDAPVTPAGSDNGVEGLSQLYTGEQGGRALAPQVTAPPPPEPVKAHESEVKKPEVIRVRMGGNVVAASLVHSVTPVYPPIAKQTRTQGRVLLSAIIARDGTISQLQAVSGHPLLVPAALDAVRQWRYRPTLLNGEPVEVITQIEVNFTLAP